MKNMEKKVINLTPHDVVVETGGKKITFPASGEVARVSVESVPNGTINGIPKSTQTFGDVVGLPDTQADTVFIVSAIVLSAAKELGRTDVVAPDTNNANRDEQGRIVSVPGFVD